MTPRDTYEGSYAPRGGHEGSYGPQGTPMRGPRPPGDAHAGSYTLQGTPMRGPIPPEDAHEGSYTLQGTPMPAGSYTSQRIIIHRKQDLLFRSQVFQGHLGPVYCCKTSNLNSDYPPSTGGRGGWGGLREGWGVERAKGGRNKKRLR